jgi:hypothetical protein
VETAVPVNGRIGPRKRLGNRRSTKPALALVVQQDVPSRPSLGGVIFPVSRLVPGLTHLLHADMDFVIAPQVSLVKLILLLLSCSDLGFVNGGSEEDRRSIVSWYLSRCSRNLSQLLSTSDGSGESNRIVGSFVVVATFDSATERLYIPSRPSISS